MVVIFVVLMSQLLVGINAFGMQKFDEEQIHECDRAEAYETPNIMYAQGSKVFLGSTESEKTDIAAFVALMKAQAEQEKKEKEKVKKEAVGQNGNEKSLKQICCMCCGCEEVDHVVKIELELHYLRQLMKQSPQIMN